VAGADGSLWLYNGRVISLSPEVEGATAVLAQDGRIKAVGSDEVVRRAARPGTPAIDLGGMTVVPGFIDSHLHLLGFGLSLDNLDLNGVRSIAEVVRLVRQEAAALPAGDWVFGRGWDQDRFAEGRYPTRDDLDLAAPDRPVSLVRSCGHVLVANTAALRHSGITRETADPPGGRIDRGESGEPTGILRETAKGLLKSPGPSRERLERALRLAVERALAVGVTSVHTEDTRGVGFAPVYDLYRRSLGREGLPFRVSIDVAYEHLDELEAAGFKTGSGDDYVKIGATKLFADGSLGASTAVLGEPYSDNPQSQGIPVLEAGEIRERVRQAHRHGLQLATHAIGDRAIELTLDAYLQALTEIPRPNHRHRIIHCQVMRPDQFRWFAALGVVADIQPKFITTDMRWAEKRVGPERIQTSYAWKTFIEAGVHVAGGSDCPVEPLNPALGLYSAVARQDLDGRPEGGWLPEQRLSVDQALRLFTLGGAYAAFEETEKGSIEPGKLADLAILRRDPRDVPGGELKDLQVQMTVVGGRVAFSRS
jgi:hypothetical protein